MGGVNSGRQRCESRRSALVCPSGVIVQLLMVAVSEWDPPKGTFPRMRVSLI